jgi:putative transposase
MTARLVTDALVMAIWRRGKPDALLHHSDRGSQYTSEQFQKLTADHGVVCSMSRSGNVWDNAVMESFFSSLKPGAGHVLIGSLQTPRVSVSETGSPTM